MRLPFALCIAAAALALAANPAFAGSCCHQATVFDGPPIVPFEAAPIYIVDEGPVLSGPGVYAYHTYVPRVYVPPLALPPEGGYAAVTPFPYVHHVSGPRRSYRR
jgi:hypothetical protein